MTPNPEIGEMSLDQAMQELERCVERLGECFSVVNVMVSWENEGNTGSAYKGAGNWYARQGLAHSFVSQAQAKEQARQIGEVMMVSEDDEDWEDFE